MRIRAADLEIFREPLFDKFHEGPAVNIKTVGDAVTRHGRHQGSPLHQAANLQAGCIMRLAALINIKNDVCIHENSHACFF